MKKLIFGVIATASVFAATCTPVFASVSNSTASTSTSYASASTNGSTMSAAHANGTGKSKIITNRFEEFFG